jgi:exodeoxyribonuclease V alpha subunit
MKESPESEIVGGTIHRVTFRNPSTGYSVLQVTLDDSSDRITAVGLCANSKVGSHVMMTGSFIAHPKFGKQFSVLSITETPPSSAEGIERYLSSGLISGVGKKTAKRIVDEFGTGALEAIRTRPAEVAALSGVGKKKADLLHTALLQQTEFDQILQFLVEHQISPTLSARIYERFRGKTVEHIKSDPYILAREIRGIGFQTADSIALKMGVAADSPLRLRAGLFFALDSASDEGHCYLSRQAILERARHLLGIEDSSQVSEQLDYLIEIQALTVYEGGIFLKQFDIAEDAVARFIVSRTGPQPRQAETAAVLHAAIADAEKLLGISLSSEQRHAVELATAFSLLVITGGPGCGKTTMIKALTVLFEKAGFAFALAAPTGRAAQRMSQVCGAPASTIHRLLKYDPLSRGFVHNSQNPLPLEALIIDEASMVDILLARDLFSAIPSRCTVVLVGDKDQLPSVGPGRVFGDLVRSRDVKVIQLSQLFRRSAESTINTVAHMINVGEVPHVPSPDGVTKSDAYFIERNEPQEAASLIETLVAEQVPRKFGFIGSEIAVLTPTNRGPLGTIELNRRIQERINPRAQH